MLDITACFHYMQFHGKNFFFFFFYCFSRFEDIHIIIVIKILLHKNRNKQIPVYSIKQHFEVEKPVKLVKHVAPFIGKELAENYRSCHQVPVAPIAELNSFILRNR